MKIAMSKHGLVCQVNEEELEIRLAAGWQRVEDQAGEDVIRLKPTVKSKATARALEEANETTVKGDE